MPLITEDQVELQSLEWFKELGFEYANGYDIAPDGTNPERDNFRKVILEDRLRSALVSINADIPTQTINNSISQILNPNIPSLLNCNRETHKWITKGLKVTFMQDNEEIGRQLKLIDFENLEAYFHQAYINNSHQLLQLEKMKIHFEIEYYEDNIFYPNFQFPTNQCSVFYKVILIFAYFSSIYYLLFIIY